MREFITIIIIVLLRFEDLPNVTASVFLLVLRFIYCGDVTFVTETNAVDLIEAANFFKCDRLKAKCEEVLKASACLLFFFFLQVFLFLQISRMRTQPICSKSQTALTHVSSRVVCLSTLQNTTKVRDVFFTSFFFFKTLHRCGCHSGLERS